jgi:hypothetical protein
MSNEIETKLAPVLADAFEDLAAFSKADAKKYGEAMAKDLANYLYRAYAKEDSLAEASLMDLRAQAASIIAKQAIHADTVLKRTIDQILKLAARTARAMLGINLPTP